MCGDPTTESPTVYSRARGMRGRPVRGSGDRPISDVVGFAEHLFWALYRLDRKEYGEGLSGDAFLYARAAVVGAGCEECEKVLRDPARFVPFVNNLVWAEALLYVPDNAYERLTGDEWDRNTRYSHESYSNAAAWTNA